LRSSHRGGGRSTIPGRACPVHVETSISLTTLGGEWHDNLGNIGPFVFTPSGVATGSPRPPEAGGVADGSITTAKLADGAVDSSKIADGSIGAPDINTAEVQARIASGCPADQFMRVVHADGTIVCEPVTSTSGGDITSVAAGAGLTGGGASGDGALAANLSQLQARVSASCPANESIRANGLASEIARLSASGAPIIRAFLAAVRGVTTGRNDAVAVVVDSLGQLGTVSSSRRTKFDIADLEQPVTDALQRLRPVQFRYRQAFSNGTTPFQYGLIAEEVQEVLPELVALDGTGQPATVKYHVLPSLLLADVQRLELERIAQDQTLQRQREEIGALREQLSALRAAVDTLTAIRR